MRLFVLWLAFMSCAALASECVVRSGAQTNALVELYTSEGCDSCPPADRWLSGLAKESPGAKGIVPVAFHVDYWDYLGWKDRFGDPRHAERQRAMARAAGARAVYTPQVMLGGRDFPGWRNGALASRLDSLRSAPARAALEIDAKAGPGAAARVSATLAPGEPTADLVLFVAITQNGLSSRVSAGENKGATLRHDFVVRGLHTARNWSADRATITTTGQFAERPDWKLADMSIVAFVQNVRTGAVLQALSAPLCAT